MSLLIGFCKLDLVPEIVKHAKISISPRLPGDRLFDLRTCLFELSIQLIKSFDKNVNCGRSVTLSSSEQMNGNVIALDNRVVSRGHCHNSSETQRSFVVAERFWEVKDG